MSYTQKRKCGGRKAFDLRSQFLLLFKKQKSQAIVRSYGFPMGVTVTSSSITRTLALITFHFFLGVLFFFCFENRKKGYLIDCN